VISIDAKKKELLGEFKNGGSDYSPQMMRWTRSWWGSGPRR
jgi:hypothetical protein